MPESWGHGLFYSGWSLFVPCDADAGDCSSVDGDAGTADGPLYRGCPELALLLELLPVLELAPLLELLLVDDPDCGCERG